MLDQRDTNAHAHTSATSTQIAVDSPHIRWNCSKLVGARRFCISAGLCAYDRRLLVRPRAHVSSPNPRNMTLPPRGAGRQDIKFCPKSTGFAGFLRSAGYVLSWSVWLRAAWMHLSAAVPIHAQAPRLRLLSCRCRDCISEPTITTHRRRACVPSVRFGSPRRPRGCKRCVKPRSG